MGSDDVGANLCVCPIEGGHVGPPLRLSDFDYTFPKGLIAYKPMTRRDQSRLLVIDRKNKIIGHRKFFDITDYLCKGDLVVLNDTKVIPAELEAEFSNVSRVELLVLGEIDRYTAKCLAKPARKFKKNTKIHFSDSSSAVVLEDYPEKVLRFSCTVDSLMQKIGKMPLPPYIKRESQKSDFKTYQTVYAKNTGAVAAPTAGLHFTKDILKKIAKKGANTANVTLHVGYGTFKPVRCDNIEEHKIHSEHFNVPKATVDAINKTREAGGRILAVGTTSCRVLETIVQGNGAVSGERLAVSGSRFAQTANRKPQTAASGWTDLFIYPPYSFKLTDMLLTNFHLPKTTLLMLVSAFCGHDLMKEAYRQAIEKRYRLFSYGDAMLIM